MRVVREEIFGPVVCVHAVRGRTTSTRIAKFANDTEYGLAGEHLDPGPDTAHTIAAQDQGRHGLDQLPQRRSTPALPFGGYKQSGWGREMGKEVMENYTETKAIGARLV